MKREKEATHSHAAQESGKGQNPEHVEKRILVVDDDTSVREMVSRVLVGEGYLVRGASNGAEALEIAAANQIDLVLLDLNMPGQSGWETFERLTTDHPLLSVIIITGRSNQVFTALGAGVGALLEKPLDFPQLLQSVSRLLAEPPELRRARTAGRASEFYYNSSHPKKTE
jgi:CheY-like chemotaxis protein